jgi:hypothetical protein
MYNRITVQILFKQVINIISFGCCKPVVAEKRSPVSSVLPVIPDFQTIMKKKLFCGKILFSIFREA